MTEERCCVSGGGVIWITGLSGSGKSTLAGEVVRRLREQGKVAVLLDGDELRDALGRSDLGSVNHGRDARLELALRYGRLCRLVASQGVLVVIATISLFHEVHAWNREHLPEYFEVYLDVPLAELRRRDPKGIYSRFDAGELDNVAGLDLPVDEPENPDWVAQFMPGRSVAELADELFNHL
ncbi:adenylylsulfate kinase [Desulfobaculum xiamenense]|uniref:Adenylylsulfate kinase n=1 Tax=Desulfobaculum xiamenense TaxID=995050 RepID=A0A846QJR6_9BACT|nr:adenylyl-sulfate kinase [Desulfobaculum xiamenense]NJB66722.1 adenylylsulfate kinase [Desulfobaculum xiamenense]